MSTRKDLIDQLSRTPLKSGPLLSPLNRSTVWVVVSLIFVTFLCGTLGPYRNGALDQFFGSPRFFAETAFGILAVFLAGVFGFQSMIPGRSRSDLGLALAILATAIFILLLVYGLIDPALAPSMAGKRSTCHLETFFLGLIPGLSAIWLAKRAFPLRLLKTAFLIGLASSLPGAIVMQFGCMYIPLHDLMFHVIPALLLTAVLTLIGYKLIKQEPK